MMIDNTIKKWLLEGDVSLQYLVHRDLLGSDETVLDSLRSRIPLEGFGKQFLEQQNENGHWGRSYYQPKWISTHYTLLDLRNIGMPRMERISKIIDILLETVVGDDGGIDPSVTINQSDVCVSGMFLNFACHFGTSEDKLRSIVDYLIDEHMEDGGFNCDRLRYRAHHGSVHSTISVLEGFLSYRTNGYKYKADELLKMEKAGQEFLLRHRLYRSERTGEVIKQDFTRFSYPCRWYYDVLRALEYFADAGVDYDSRMDDALSLLTGKKNKAGKWPLQNRHAGAVHFEMEKPSRESRINTYRALKVMKYIDSER